MCGREWDTDKEGVGVGGGGDVCIGPFSFNELNPKRDLKHVTNSSHFIPHMIYGNGNDDDDDDSEKNSNGIYDSWIYAKCWRIFPALIFKSAHELARRVLH